ncbi:MAG: hypothetical protein ACMUIE_09300 [Thermoplasmatota archaeon]
MRSFSGDERGIETPFSMFLLMTSLLLMISIGDILVGEKNTEEGLLELRMVQVDSMGRVLSTFEPAGGNGTLLSLLFTLDENFVVLLENGNCSIVAGEDLPFQQDLIGFSRCVPDGLRAFIMIESYPPIGIRISGEFAGWERTLGERSIRIVLPIGRGSLELEVEDEENNP